MRHLLLALPLLLMQAPPALAQVSLGIGIQLPGISIGIDLPAYPDMQRVPGYPVYYAPRARHNYFFYDGLYWVFEGDNWYSSGWYNGPWQRIGPDSVPLYVLRVPVRYYRQPPAYFRTWRADAPPRWDDHWGRDWAQRRPGWDRWNRSAAPPPAPLPTYQRKYPQSRYPQEAARQQAIRVDEYRYRPREPVARPQMPQRDGDAGPRRPAPQPAAVRAPRRDVPDNAHPRSQPTTVLPRRPDHAPAARAPGGPRDERTRGGPDQRRDAPGQRRDGKADDRESNGRGGR